MTLPVDIPDFDPKLTPAEGMYRYYDGRVSGVMDIGEGWAVIYEWSSAFKGHGHTVEGLKWLRDQGAKSITAFNMGMPPEAEGALSPHAAYWIHIQSLGLVDKLIDDDGQIFLLPVGRTGQMNAIDLPEALEKKQLGLKHSSSMEPGL